MINKKIKLTLPRFKFSVANLLAFVDISCVIAALFGVLSSTIAENAIKIWISAVVVLLASRLIRLLYFGASSFPQVKFDIALLTTITGLLMLTLVQASSISYVSLSGDNNWSVGVLLLSAVTLYLMQTILNNYPQVTKWVFRIVSLSLFLILLGNLPNDIANMVTRPSRLVLGVNLIAIFSLIFSFVGIAWHKSLAAKSAFILLLVISLPYIISSIAQGQFALVLISLALFVVITPMANLSRAKKLLGEIGTSLKQKQSLSTRSSLIILAIGLVTSLSIVSFIAMPDFLLQSFASLQATLTRFPGATEVILGMGLTPNFVDAASLLLSYGTAGLLLVGLFLSSLIQAIRTISLKGGLTRALPQLAGIAIVLYSLSIILTETVSIAARLVMITGMAFIFFQSMPAKSAPFKLTFKFAKIMPNETWRELFIAFRILATISAIVLIPVAIDFVIAIF